MISGGFASVGASIARRFAEEGSNVILLHGPSSRSCAEILANSINAKKAGIAVLAQVDFSALCLDSPPGEYYYPQKKQRVPNAMEEEEGNEVDDGPQKHECANYVLDETLRMFGRVDILVHADDVCRKGSLVDIDEAFFDQMIRANVKEPLFLTKFVAPYMNEGGRILFLSSFITQATTVLPKALMYAGCKGAVEQLTRVLAKDLGQRGITVNTIALGPIDTPVFRVGKSSAELERIATLCPGKRIAYIDEIMPTVVFLATREAGWVNGQVIAVNGGYIV